MAIDAEQLNILLQVRDKQFAKAMERNTRTIQRFSAKTNANLSRSSRDFARLSRAAKALLPVILSAFSVQVAAGAARFGKEISNLANITGLSASRFQELAAGARTVGISSEKLADIYKDVNDRVGEFLETGGGPMKDFFENIAPVVGVTADQFARLSGPEALQLYVNTLERAGASQQEMTFYLEAMASDTAALIPLLRDGGREMSRLGDEAKRAGRIMSDETVKQAAALDDQFQDIKDTLNKELVKALADSSDEIQILADFVQDYGIPALESLIGFAASAATGFTGLTEAVAEFIRLAKVAAGIEDSGSGAVYSPQDGGPGWRHPDDPPAGPGMTRYLDENGNVREYGDDDVIELPGITVPLNRPPPVPRRRAPSPGRPGGGGGSSRDREMNRLLRERDAILEDLETATDTYNRKVEELDQLQAKGLLTTEQYDQALKKLNEELVAQKYDRVIRGIEDVADAMAQAIVSGENMGEALGNVFRQIAAELIASNLRNLFTQTFSALSGGASGGSGGGWLASLFKKRAAGGTAMSGQAHWVGEHGPEPFIPKENGRILSVGQAKSALAGAGSGGPVVHQTVNITTGIQQTVRAELRAMMPEFQRAATAAVADLSRRSPAYRGSL